jgi:thioesterase domain-containing protein
VHPGNGEVFILTNLAKYFFNDRPFYALRPRGFNEGEELFTSFDEIVTTYVDAICKQQAHGPYAIAGYSLGCRIAFEIAKRIEARGERIAFLGIIDMFPGYESTSVDFATIAVALAFVTDLINKEQCEELGKSVYTLPPEQDLCEYILRAASRERLAQLGIDLDKFSVWARVAHSLEQLVLTHLTSGLVEAMTIFCSHGTSYYTEYEWPKHEWREQLERWKRFTKCAKFVEVPGHHHTLMSPKNVTAFQAILRHEIDLEIGDSQH